MDLVDLPLPPPSSTPPLTESGLSPPRYNGCPNASEILNRERTGDSCKERKVTIKDGKVRTPH